MPYRRAPEAVRRNTRVLLRLLLDDFRPTVLAVEENSIGSNGTGSLLHVMVSETKRIGRREGIEVVPKTASTVKKLVTGNGRATKEEVARACALCYPQLKAYLRQTAKWRTQYHGNMFDAVALGMQAQYAGTLSEPQGIPSSR
jgi:Holliday junction resolvasome RuvABC endonuclease subunit